MKRKIGWAIGMMSAAALGGCGSSIHDATGPGPVDKGFYRDAVAENEQRLAGEDHRVVPLYKTPIEAIGIGLDAVFVRPWVHLFIYISHDNAAYAARKMADTTSADKRVEGTLRLVDFEFARRGIYLKGYAYEARETEDFTVRAAGLRALNRCRAQGYSWLFLQALNDDQPLVRLEAADALGNIPDAQAVGLLEIHMGDAEPNEDVRIASAEALRNYHTTEVMHALVGELEDHDFAVAWQARQSLELLTGQDFRYDPKAWLTYLAGHGT
ncbi:MAG: HEAT repeat domain-containing protein [Tepidisphaeraceae bacterium]